MAQGLFVTSSGTEIGKTFVTAALIHQLRAAGRTLSAAKPLLSGFDEADVAGTDTGVILTALGRTLSPANIDAVTPWRFAAALSPDMAAEREGRSIDFGELVSFTRNALGAPDDIVLVEGVGGVMAPVGADHTVLDWMAAVGAPALLVVGGYLGTISHTLTAAKVIRGAGLDLKGIVISARGELPVPPGETAAAIARYLPDVPIAIVPELGDGAAAWRDAPDLLTPLGLRT